MHLREYNLDLPDADGQLETVTVIKRTDVISKIVELIKVATVTNKSPDYVEALDDLLKNLI